MTSDKKSYITTDEVILSAKEAAALLQCTPDYITKLAREGKLDGIQNGKGWVVTHSSLKRYQATRDEQKAERSKDLAQERRRELIASTPLSLKHASVALVLSLVLGAATFSLASIIKHDIAGIQTASLARVESPFFASFDLGGVVSSMRDAFARLFAPTPTLSPIANQNISAPNTATTTIVNSYTTSPVVERIIERIVAANPPAGDGSYLGTVRLNLNCAGFASGGKLTTDSSGAVICSNDHTGGGSAGGGASTFSGLTGTVAVTQGGTGLTTAPSNGQVLLGNASGGYDLVATSSLGINGVTNFVDLDDTPSSLATGDILYASAANTLSALSVGSNGQVLKLVGGIPTWSTDLQGSGGAGLFSTTSDSLAVHPADTSYVVLFGNNATTTTGNILEVTGNSLFRGSLTAYNTITAPSFVATSTTAISTFINASTTALSATTFAAGGTATTSIASNGALTIQSLSGLLKATAGLVSAAVAGTDYENPLTFTYPLSRSGDTISLAFGTTTSNTWAGTQTFTNAPILSSFSGLVAANSGATYATATGTVSSGTGISVTAGQYIIGSGLTITNTGVTSLTGTANQISASASTGAVTLSLPSHVIFPGTFEVSAASTTNATSTNITATGIASTTSLYISSIANAILSTQNGGAVGATTISAPLSFSGSTLSITQATASTDGYLSSAHWNVFNNKVGSSSLETFAATYKDWNIVGGALVPTSTIGIIVSASSTINSLTTINSTSTNATTTNLAVSGIASTTSLTISGLGSGSTQCLQVNGSGTVSGTGSACGAGGGGGADPFPSAATSTLLTFGSGLISQASSTIYALSTINSTSTNATTTNLSTTLASTTNLTISSVLSSLLKTSSSGVVSAAVAGTDYLASYDAWTHPSAGISATTSGLIISASSTINSLTTVNSTSTNATTTNLAISGALTFNGVTATTWAAFCSTITGSADLCDGVDASGSGGGSDTNWTFFNGSGIRPATSTNQVLIGGTATTSLESPLAKLGVFGGASIDYASTTGITASYASSTNLVAGNLTIGSLTGLLKAASGVVSAAVAGTDYLASYDAWTHPSAGISATTSGLIISASSTINSLTTVNSTSTNATTTNLAITALQSALLATNAQGSVVATTSLSIAQYLTGILPVANGGTGASSLTSGQLLYGAGTGAVQTVATGTVAGANGISVTAGQYIIGSGLTITGTNAAADAATKGVATFAAADFNDNGSGVISLDYTNGQAASASAKGFLTSTDWNVFNNKVGSSSLETFAATYKDWNIVGGALVPTSTIGIIVSASSTINSLTTINSTSTNATTTALYVSGLASTTNFNTNTATVGSATAGSLTIGSLSGVVAANSGATYATATGTVSGSSQVSVTSDRYVLGGSLTIDIVGDSIGDSQLAFNTGQNLTTASTPTFANLIVTGNSTTTNATTTNLAVSSTASTSVLIVSTLAQASSQCVTSNSIGLLSLQDCAAFSYLFPSNATSTLLTFSGGLLSTASTTIGNGTQGGGLTISGGATTTGNAYFASNVSVGTTTPYSKLTIWGTSSLFEAVNNSSTTIFSIGQAGATTTTFSVSGTASTTNLTVSSLGSSGTQCVQVNTIGQLSGTGNSCGAGSGSGDSSWEFFNTSGIRLATTSNQVLIGGNATSSAVALLEVAGGNILHIASSSPTLATTSASASKTYDVAIAGRLAYLADFDTGLRIIDISNPKLTATVGTYSTGLDNTVSVVVANNYAYIGDEFAGIKILDVANPASPTLVGSYSAITGPYDLDISGKYLFAVDYNDDELHIIDISDPATPTVAAVYTSGLLAPYGVAVYGRYAYVASQDNGDIVVVDISNPKSPALAGTYAGDGAPAALYVSGKYLYVADAGAGFYILDVSNPTSPSLVSGSAYDAAGAYYGVQVAGNYAYITNHAGTLRVLNVANPQSVSLVGSYTTGGAPWNLAVSGKYAYVAADTSGLKVVDINGIEAPAANIGAIETNTANVSDTLTVGGDITANGSLSVGISGIFSRGTIAAYVASSTQSNPMAATFMGGNVGVGTTTAYSKLTTWGTGSLFEAVNNSSTTIFRVGQNGATTTSFAITSVLSGLLKTDSAGNVVAAVAGTDYANFGYLFPNNATTTGLGIYASTTIGAGTQAGGLTISGGATTTGNAYFENKVGIGTTTPFATFSIHAAAGENSFAIGSSSSSYFVVNSVGRVGIGTTTPTSRLAITDTVSEAQFTLAYDATRYTTLQTNATGNLVVHASNGGASGGGVILSDDNLWVCQSGTCPSITPVDTAGNLFVENSVYVGANGHHLRQISSTELGLYNGDNELIVTFDEGL